MNSVTLIDQLRKCFKEDRQCFYYHGDFDDDFTDKIISIADHGLSKKSKRRMSFLIAESFQNVIRHGDDKLSKQHPSLFGIRSLGSFLHVFSSNIVDKTTKQLISEKLTKVEGLSQEDLKIFFRQELENSTMNDKGGAGLGLIGMALKSKNPLQYFFNPCSNGTYLFNMQIDFSIEEDPAKNYYPLDIEENTSMHELIIKNQIIFMLKGDFSDDLIMPLLSILEGNTETDASTGSLIYHAAVEMIQNIVHHATTVDEKREAIFCLIQKPNGYLLCSGNFVNNDLAIDNFIDKINVKKKSELDELYRKTLKESVSEEANNARVGLIDIRRNIEKPFEYKISKSSLGTYFVMGMEINNK